MDENNNQFDYMSPAYIADQIFGPTNDPMVDIPALRERTIRIAKAHEETVAHYLKVEANMFEVVAKEIADPSHSMDLLYLASRIREVAFRVENSMAGRDDIHTVAGMMYAGESGRRYAFSKILQIGKYALFIRH